jgi:hypothetical protein
MPIIGQYRSAGERPFRGSMVEHIYNTAILTAGQ